MGHPLPPSAELSASTELCLLSIVKIMLKIYLAHV